MASIQHVRGSGVRLTLPYVLRFSGLWLVVTMVAVVVFALTSYLALADRLTDEARHRLLVVLTIQTLCVFVAVFALAVFTTHRLAGPLIGIRRALEDVRDGKLDRALRFRRSDPHLGDLEDAFNQMVVSLRQQIAHPGESSESG
jgi:nitrogen fixation/metabolism regulation signal transduction histidine kinase